MSISAAHHIISVAPTMVFAHTDQRFPINHCHSPYFEAVSFNASLNADASHVTLLLKDFTMSDSDGIVMQG